MLPLFRGNILLEALGVTVDDGQGCFQLMGDVGNQALAPLLGIPGIVQGGAKPVKLRQILRQGVLGADVVFLNFPDLPPV